MKYSRDVIDTQRYLLKKDSDYCENSKTKTMPRNNVRVGH